MSSHIYNYARQVTLPVQSLLGSLSMSLMKHKRDNTGESTSMNAVSVYANENTVVDDGAVFVMQSGLLYKLWNSHPWASCMTQL